MFKKISLLMLVLLPLLSVAQEDQKFSVKWSGYVKNDLFYDSRQTVAAREGHLLLFPTNISLDEEGKDVNDKSNFNFLSIQSRLKASLSGPDAFGAKTSGVIEGAFFGQTNGDVNGFRLRHAFTKLTWEKTELLIGQYWHPMFITGCFPDVVSFNTGVPFQPLSRNPQIRLSRTSGSLKLIGVLQSQRDFPNAGPSTTAGSSSYLRNAGIPDFHIQFQHQTDQLFAGIGLGYKTIMPELITSQKYKTDATVSSMSAIGFCKITTDLLTVKLEGTYSQNGSDYLALGGYTVSNITDPAKGYKEYSPIASTSVWTDIHTNGENIQAGIFAGYAKNLGSQDQISDPLLSNPISYGQGLNISSLYRVAPRVVFNSGKSRIALEAEYTNATYGKDLGKGKYTIDANTIPTDTQDVGNLRFLIGVFYFF